ncbi:MAG: hypothetical protein Salg2KO_14330 [Salibacteraceae bacterium]
MKTVVYIIIVLLLVSCAKNEQLAKTEFKCRVIDITTGQLAKEANVSLYEYHTPSQPFSPISKTLVEHFNVPYGESFAYEFNARRGNGYSYILEFERLGEKFFEAESEVNGDSDPSGKCTLSKKIENTCILNIMPLAHIRLDGENRLNNPSTKDSIWSALESNGDILARYSHKGVGSGAWGGGDIPHGHYDLKYQVFADGIEIRNVVNPIYIEHNLDSTIVIEY